MKNLFCQSLLYFGCLLAIGCSTDSQRSDSNQPDSKEALSASNDDRILGRWTASLESPGGKLFFEIDISKSGDRWTSRVINGDEVIPVDKTELKDHELEIGFPHYNSKIVASFDEDNRLQGTWLKVVGKDKVDKMTFFAEKKARPFSSENASSLVGRYSVKFSSSDDPAVGIFRESGNRILGTFLTTTGDYRYLAGDFDGESRQLRLSCFDGGHAFLFTAAFDEEGGLAGEFWSRGNWHETWKAQKDAGAKIADGFDQVKWQGISLGDISFPDLNGKLHALDDPTFDGKIKLVQIFGSWCPNCHDASLFLSQLQEDYADRGLSIVGLAFELTGDFERDKLQIKEYRKRTGCTYPILIAGLSDKKKAAKQLKLLDEVKSYPTSIFLDANNKPIAIHSGFSGPATGDAYLQLQRRFRKIIEEAVAD